MAKSAPLGPGPRPLPARAPVARLPAGPPLVVELLLVAPLLLAAAGDGGAWASSSAHAQTGPAPNRTTASAAPEMVLFLVLFI